MARRTALTDVRGFALAELLVVCAVLGLMMAGLLAVQVQGQQAYQMGAARVEVQQNARGALDLMMTELRFAKAITAVGAGCDTGPVPTGGGATTISITDQDNKAVVYQLTGTNLQRTYDGGAATTLVGGAQTLRFWCYDSNGALTAAAATVRSVQVRMQTGSESPGAARNQHALVEARVRLRSVL
jgi:type II secretory pathway pseudopilin PulG